MSQIITNFVGPIAGGLVSGSIGMWMFWRKRLRDGKDAFLLATADLRAKLASTSKTMLENFYEQSIPVMGQAAYRVTQFLNEDQKIALDNLRNEYRTVDKKLFGTGVNVLAHHYETGLTPEKRLEEFFERFDECIKTRKPTINQSKQ